MFQRLTKIASKHRWSRNRSLVLLALVALFVATSLLLWPAPAEAHCDAVSGPVVTAAAEALEAGDVNLILPYVRPEYEEELTAAFEQTLVVRKRGSDARQLADRYFFETAVRLHRAGEGAPYTGLKEGTDFGPALEAADKALATGSLDDVYTVLDDAIQHGVGERYQEVLEARQHEAEAGTVEAARARVEAELRFEQYVYALHQAALGEAAHAAEGGAAAHE